MQQDGRTSARTPFRTWYVLAVVSTISAFAYMDRNALSILQEPIKAELGLSDKQLGLLSGLGFAALHATLGIPMARLADRGSRVKLLCACLTVWSVMTAFCGLARSFPILFAARMGVGVGQAGFLPAAHSILGDTFSRERRTLAVAVCQCGAVIGINAGMFLVGAFGETLGWRLSLQIAGLLGLPVALLAILTLKDPERQAASSAVGALPASHEAVGAALKALLSRPALVLLILGYTAASTWSSGLSPWMPSFLMRSFGMSMTQVGAWLGATSALAGVCGLLTGGLMTTWLMPRDPRWEHWIPAAAYTACLPLYLLLVFSPSPWIALACQGVMSYLSAAGAGVCLAGAQSYAEPHRRATSIALLVLASSLIGNGLGPLIVGTVSDFLQPTLGKEALRYAFLAPTVLLIGAVAMFLGAAARSPKDRVN